VRVGMPTGIKGITQLVTGPEYATSVGLVKYGARAICIEAMPQTSTPASLPKRQRGAADVEVHDARRYGLWEWIKAAF